MSNIQKSETHALFQRNNVQQRFEKLLGKKAPGFITSVLQVVQNSGSLSKANPQTVLNAAATAAALDLPINPNLGFAWIVPYKGQAQFQLGWRGYVQLALRTGQYERMNVTQVYENQFNSWNAMTEELDADFSIEGTGEVVGYVAYFRLINGYEKTSFWSKAKVEAHAKKYSQSYGRRGVPWSDLFDEMALKTVLKNTLSKWGIMSIELQTAQLADQSIQVEEGEYQYLDNAPEQIEDKTAADELARAKEWIEKAEGHDDLDMIEESFIDRPDEINALIEAKRKEIDKEQKK